MNDTNPDYVVVGETRGYNYVALEKAVALVRKGAGSVVTDPSLPVLVPSVPCCSRRGCVLLLHGMGFCFAAERTRLARARCFRF
jgi:hypothetical protein